MPLRALIQGDEGASLTCFRGADTTFNVHLTDEDGLPVPLNGTNVAMVEGYLNDDGTRTDDPDFVVEITPDGTHSAAGFGTFKIEDSRDLPRGTHSLFVRHDDGTGDSGEILSIDVINGASGYTTAPAVTITGREGSGTGATATSQINGSVSGVTITAGGTGYVTASTTVTFSAPTLPGGVQATGTASVSSGAVTAINVTNPGSGYTSPPTITIGGVGSGATATCAIAGPVHAVTVTAPGSGYFFDADVEIAFSPNGSRATANANIARGETQVSQTHATLLVR
jgi:hypothetical protein